MVTNTLAFRTSFCKWQKNTCIHILLAKAGHIDVPNLKGAGASNHTVCAEREDE